MKKPLSKQLSYIFDLEERKAYKILLDDLATYILKINGMYYVGIPFNKHKVNEKFVGMQIKTEMLVYDNVSINCLCLIAGDNIDYDKFMLISEDFAKTSNRALILKDPYSWIDKWRTLFGDSLSNKKIYDVLGELISLRECYKRDKSYIWEGPNSGTHDLVGEKSIVEVKTTHLKKANIVGIHSSFQLSVDKPTNLFFVRLEKKPYCLTINKLVKELSSLGYDETKLEDSLSKLGYSKGSRSREASYDLLSLYSYPISKETFPVFGLDELNDKFAPSKNIISYSLEIDLSGIIHDVIYEKE